jgi:RNAse (barnase) inhibitor barstar
LPVPVLDGARFSDLEGFYDEVSNHLIPGAAWGRKLDALNDTSLGEALEYPKMGLSCAG